MIIITANTIDRLLQLTLEKQLNGTKKNKLSLTSPNAYHLFNTILRSSTCRYDFDISRKAWLTKGRWRRLVNDYIDKSSLYSFIEKCVRIIKHKDSISTCMLFKSVSDKNIHEWGNCLLAMTFCNNKLTMYSRTTYVGYIFYLDAAIAHVIARMLCKECGMHLEQFSFDWHITNQQLSYLKTLPTLLLHPRLRLRLEELVRTKNRNKECWYQVSRVYRQRILGNYKGSKTDFLKSLKFGPLKRVGKKWLGLREGPLNLPSVLVKDLDFEGAWK